jgi:hypothetical protein
VEADEAASEAVGLAEGGAEGVKNFWLLAFHGAKYNGLGDAPVSTPRFAAEFALRMCR